jgi:hypothetical protein
MMGRSLVYGSVAVAGLFAGTAMIAEAGDSHGHHGHGHHSYGHGHHSHGYGHHSHGYGHRGYGVGISLGYAPRPVYAPPPAYVYGPPIYPQPVYVAPPPYHYGYAPYPAYPSGGFGVSTKNFGLWLGR